MLKSCRFCYCKCDRNVKITQNRILDIDKEYPPPPTGTFHGGLFAGDWCVETNCCLPHRNNETKEIKQKQIRCSQSPETHFSLNISKMR